MPNVTALPRQLGDGSVVTEFIDSVGTTTTTFTYPYNQSEIRLFNKGLANITLTINGRVYTVLPGAMVTVNESIVSFDIKSTQGTQQFEARASRTESTELIFVERFGAKGEGDDTDALKKALTIGGQVNLQRNKTYLFSARLTMAPGTILQGNGATLKRIDEVRTTTTTAITAGPSPITLGVTDVTGFKVGMDVILVNGSTYTPQTHRINAINGNNVTIETNVGENYAIGSYMQTACYGVVMTDNCEIYDLKIDGNKVKQTTVKWETHQEIVTANNCIIEGATILNAASEGILVAGTNVRVEDCYIQDSGGNGIHFSGASNVVVDGCSVVNANLTTGTGHEDGCIIWSNQCQNITVTNCWMENGLSGIGSIDSVDNSDATIVNNVIKNCRTYAIKMICASKNPANVIFKNNRIYNSVKVVIQETSASAATLTIPNKIIFEGNYLEKTWVDLNHIKDFIMRGNILDSTAAAPAISIAINAYNMQDSVFEGNDVIGADYGIYIGDTLAITANVMVINNKFKNQRLYGIRLQAPSQLSISANNNDVSNDATSDATYTGILVHTGAMAQGNQINLAVGAQGISCYTNSYILNNIIRTPAAIPSIKNTGGTTGIMIMNNLTTQAISNGGGASNTILNNQTIAL